jgi:hypothetical protein
VRGLPPRAVFIARAAMETNLKGDRWQLRFLHLSFMRDSMSVA